MTVNSKLPKKAPDFKADDTLEAKKDKAVLWVTYYKKKRTETCEASGLGYEELRWALDRHKQSKDPNILPKGLPGRPKTVSDNGKIILKTKIGKMDLSCASNTDEQILAMVDIQRREERIAVGDTSPPKPTSERHDRDLVKELAPEVCRTTSFKNFTRKRVLHDMFCPISHGVVLRAVLDITNENPKGRFMPSFIFNIDAVSSLVGGAPDNIKIHLAAGSTAALKKLRRSPSVTLPRGKQRVVKQFYVTAPDGYLLVAIIIVKDNHIKELTFHCITKYFGGYELWLLMVPNQTRVSDSSSGGTSSISSVLSNARAVVAESEGEDAHIVDSTIDDDLEVEIDDEGNTVTTLQDTVIMEIILNEIVIPAMERKREIIQTEMEDLCRSASRLTVSSASNSSSNVTPTMRKPMLLTFDGDHPQIEAVFNKVLATAQTENIDLFKFPGGCSLMYQPDDLMKAFAIIHQYTHSKQYRATKLFDDPPWLPLVKTLLATAKIDKASMDCFLDFFRQLPTIVSKAFTHSTITSGWTASGIYPFDPEKILEKCVKFTDLNAEEQQRCRDAVGPRSELVEAARLSGMCTDGDIETQLGDILSTEVKNLHLKVVNQQRSLWMNKEGVLTHRRALHAAKLVLEQEAEVRRLARLETAAEKKRRQDAIALDHQAVVNAHVEEYCFNQTCAHPTTLRVVNLRTDDGWRCCPYCDVPFCFRKPCQERLLRHMPDCSLKAAKRRHL